MSERSSVQNPMIKYSQEIGWEYISQEKALLLRHGDTGVYFIETLREQLIKLNPSIINPESADSIIKSLNLLKSNIDGNRDALSWLRGEHSIYIPEEKRERNVRLIDFDKPSNNVYNITDEWFQRGTPYNTKADVVFLINGIPIAIAETKSASVAEGLAKGVDQIRRYHRETPELLVPTQVFEVTQLIQFFYGVTWNMSRKNIFNWKEEQPNNYEGMVKSFFDRVRFIKVLHDYIIFLTKDDELTKIILRQHQTRAVDKVITRIQDPVKKRGLIWHTQGSGKTLTMITIASKLLRESFGTEKPTILMIVDRNELESQLFKNIAGYGILNVKVATSKKELRDVLASDYRGLIVTMIHKFEGMPADINKRDNVIVLVDEAHRTTGGDLGNYLMAALPNAKYIGFTGTPIDNLYKGQGTFKVFGYEDGKGYLDKYSIAESIEDGTTVKLNYALAPSSLRVDKDLLEKEFLSNVEAEGISDIDELNGILDRAVKLKEMMKSPKIMEEKSAFIAKHFVENVEPMGFKAFLVAVDREACALYKNILDKYLPQEYTEVVYSPTHNDKELLKKYYHNDEDEKKIRKAFLKKGGNPKILIVTEKLLTGFDAPILYCMYLDKPMRDHVLLQAIARVNRPYDDEAGQVKPYGFVLDFVGIFDSLEKALAFDSDVVASVIQNIDVLKNLFAKMMNEDAKEFLPLTEGWDDKSKERAIDYFTAKKDRERFFKFYRQLQNLYTIISPDAFLGPYIQDYRRLAELYAILINAYNSIYIDKEITAKTQELLRKYTHSEDLEVPGAVHELGPEELNALKRRGSSDHSKTLNLRKILSVIVERDVDSHPFLRPIGERAEALAQLYEDRQVSTQDALQGFVNLAQEYIEADEERRKLGVDENTFAIYTAIKPTTNKITKEDAVRINEEFKKYPDYQWNYQQMGKLKEKIYKILLPIVGKENLFNIANTLLRLQRI